MIKAKAAIAGILSLFAVTAALAQSAPATMPYHTVYGRIGATPGDTGPGQAIPFATLQTFSGALIAVNNLSDLPNKATARTNLGVAIGTNVEAWDADLDCLAALGTTGIVRRTGAGTCSAGTLATLAEGGTNAALTADFGGIVYSTASAFAILPHAASIGLPMLSGAGGAPSWSTIFYPTSATSGGVAYFSSTTQIASSALLAANQIMLGGGAGVAPATLGSLGTTSTVLHGNAAGAPSFGAVAIGSDVSGLGSSVASILANGASTAGGMAQTVAGGSTALGTGAIASATCATAVTATATNTGTTDTVTASFNGDPTAVTGYVPLTTGMLTIIVYPTANNVNFKVCNNTAGSITPGAITLNWRVVR